jgi:hypothetical protein
MEGGNTFNYYVKIVVEAEKCIDTLSLASSNDSSHFEQIFS